MVPVDMSAVLTDMWSSELCSTYVCDSARLKLQDWNCVNMVDSSADAAPKPGKVARADDVFKSMKPVKNQSDHDLIEPGVYHLIDEVSAHSAFVGNSTDYKLCPHTQPFGVMLHPQVAVVCDAHAHMCEAEVIGLLAGYSHDAMKAMNDELLSLPLLQNSGGKSWILVQQAFPCLAVAVPDDDGSTDVELDSVSEWKAREAIQALGMEVVGWYHSHPKFKPYPSIIDIQNQTQYQRLMRKSDTGFEPFIGLIVSTYDKAIKSASSVFQWFHTVEHTVIGRQQTTIDIPMNIHVTDCLSMVENGVHNSSLSCADDLIKFKKETISFDVPRICSPVKAIDISQSISASDTVEEAVFSARGRQIKRNLVKSRDDEFYAPPKRIKESVKVSGEEVKPIEIPTEKSLSDCLFDRSARNYDSLSPESQAAVELMFMCPMRYRSMILSLISLGYYYRSYPGRVELLQDKWKEFDLKLSKVMESISAAFHRLVVVHNDKLNNSILLSKYEEFLRICWTKRS